MSRTSQIIGMSEELKDALGEYAQTNDLSIADCARQAIAEFIGYDLDAEAAASGTKKGRPRVYADKAERRAAARARGKEKRTLAKQLIEEHRRQERAAELAKMQASVEAAEKLAKKQGKK